MTANCKARLYGVVEMDAILVQKPNAAWRSGFPIVYDSDVPRMRYRGFPDGCELSVLTNLKACAVVTGRGQSLVEPSVATRAGN